MNDALPSRTRRGIVAGLLGSMMLLFLLLSLAGTMTEVSEVATDERLVFFPTHASYDAKKNAWRVHLHAWLHEPEHGAVTRRVLKTAVGKGIGVPDDSTARSIFESRIAPFLADNERDKRVVVRIGGKRFTLGRTASDGHVEKTVEIPADVMAEWRKKSSAKDGWVPFAAVLPKRDSREFNGRFLVLPERGVSVISDLDDTIKITNVTSRDAMLANTFYRSFRPVEGMSQLYRDLGRGGAAFHYVSASPWQLTQPLTDMLEKARFPRGSLHLRVFRLQSVRSLDDLTGKNSKQPTLERLITENSQRRFVLFGDSGERDPEIYGTLTRTFPDRIIGIFIRNVTKEAATDKRFRDAFDKIDAGRWMLFDNPADVRPRLRAMSLIKSRAE